MSPESSVIALYVVNTIVAVGLVLILWTWGRRHVPFFRSTLAGLGMVGLGLTPQVQDFVLVQHQLHQLHQQDTIQRMVSTQNPDHILDLHEVREVVEILVRGYYHRKGVRSLHMEGIDPAFVLGMTVYDAPLFQAIGDVQHLNKSRAEFTIFLINGVWINGPLPTTSRLCIYLREVGGKEALEGLEKCND